MEGEYEMKENEVIFTEENLVIQGYSGAGKAFAGFITDFTEEGE